MVGTFMLQKSEKHVNRSPLPPESQSWTISWRTTAWTVIRAVEVGETTQEITWSKKEGLGQKSEEHQQWR